MQQRTPEEQATVEALWRALAQNDPPGMVSTYRHIAGDGTVTWLDKDGNDCTDMVKDMYLNALHKAALRDPSGPKEFWREEIVGVYTHADGHVLTDAEFEQMWAKGNDDEFDGDT